MYRLLLKAIMFLHVCLSVSEKSHEPLHGFEVKAKVNFTVFIKAAVTKVLNSKIKGSNEIQNKNNL